MTQPTFFQSCWDCFLGWMGTKHRIKCFAQGKNKVPMASFKLATLEAQVVEWLEGPLSRSTTWATMLLFFFFFFFLFCVYKFSFQPYTCTEHLPFSIGIFIWPNQISNWKIPFLTLKAPIATKSRMVKCLRSLYGKQCGPRSDCSYKSSLFWVHAVWFYT